MTNNQTNPTESQAPKPKEIANRTERELTMKYALLTVKCTRNADGILVPVKGEPAINPRAEGYAKITSSIPNATLWEGDAYIMVVVEHTSEPIIYQALIPKVDIVNNMIHDIIGAFSSPLGVN